MWRIAIIDDDRQVLAGMRNIIPWGELNAVYAGEAEDGKQGLELVRQANPDIVITDIYMPVMNGLEMLEALRQSGCTSRFVILSGYSDFEYARQALRLEVTDYLTKPVSIATIRNVLRKVIRSLEEEAAERQEQHELMEQVSQFRPYLEKECLKSLVTGSYDPRLERMRESGEIRLPEREFVVLAVEIAGSPRLVEPGRSDTHLFRFAVANIMEELLQARWPEAAVLELYYRYLAVLLPIPEHRPATDEQVNELCRMLTDEIRHYLQLSIRIGIGERQRGPRQIVLSTEQAFQALTDASGSLAGDGNIRRLPVIPGARMAGGRIRRVPFYQEVAESIRLLQEERTIRRIRAFVGEWTKDGGVFPEDVRRIAAELWTIFAYAVHEEGYSLEDLFADDAVQQELSRLQSPADLSQWFEEKTRSICRRLQRNGDNLRHRQAVDYMIEYIHAHYAEDIRLSDLADQVHLSRNYLSTLFRNATGETFQDYLTRVRMEKAKRFILEGKHLIYEVAEKVGYRNVPYFSTLFKKHTGMNPTDLLKGPIDAAADGRRKSEQFGT